MKLKCWAAMHNMYIESQNLQSNSGESYETNKSYDISTKEKELKNKPSLFNFLQKTTDN